MKRLTKSEKSRLTLVRGNGGIEVYQSEWPDYESLKKKELVTMSAARGPGNAWKRVEPIYVKLNPEDYWKLEDGTRQEYIDSRSVLVEGIFVHKRMYELLYEEQIKSGLSLAWNDLIISLMPFGTESEESFQSWKRWAKENRRLVGCKHPDTHPEFAKEFNCETKNTSAA